MSKALDAARRFEVGGVDADLLDQLDSTEIEKYLGVPSSDGQVLSSLVDGTRQWTDVVSIIEWGDIQGTLSNQADLWTELENRYLKSETFSQSEHISISNGNSDQGKPIVLSLEGKIHPSMLDTGNLTYVGTHDPSSGTEYPSASQNGQFWVVSDLMNPDNPSDPLEDQYYTFQTGDLVGKQIFITDMMIYGDTWSISKSGLNPMDFMKLDKSTHFVNNNNPLVVYGQIKEVQDAVDANDAVNKSQLDLKADLTDLSGFVKKSGDLMTGSLVVDDGGVGTAGLGVSNGVNSANIQWNYFELRSDTHHFRITDDFANVAIDFKFDNDTAMTINPFEAPKTKYSPVNDNDLTRKDYVDTKEPSLGLGSAGQVLATNASATDKEWVDLPNDAVWGNITGALSNQTDLWNELTSLSKVDGSRPFTGDVTFNYDLNIGSTGTSNGILNFWDDNFSNYSATLEYDYTENRFKVNKPLYSSQFISSAGTIRTGYNTNNNSVYEFTDPSGPEIPTIFWHNIGKDFFVDTNNALNLRLFHEGNLDLMPVPQPIQDELDQKEDSLGLGTDGQVLATVDNNGVLEKDWIDVPSSVNSFLDLTDTPTDYTGSANGFVKVNTTEDGLEFITEDYVNKIGDTMTGTLVIENSAPMVLLRDTDDNKETRLLNYPNDFYIQTDKTNVIISSTQGNPLTGEVYVKKDDGTHSFYHSGNDGAGSNLDADLLDGMQPNELPISDATQIVLDTKLESQDVYLRTEFVNTSTPNAPIILDANGKINPNMIDIGTMYYVGPHDPTIQEYPDTTGHSTGAYWQVIFTDGTTTEYTFTGGDLQGETVKEGDYLYFHELNGFSIIVSAIDPNMYMRLDKSTALDNNGVPLVVNGRIENVQDGVNDTDVSTVGQSVQKSGDLMTGDLSVQGDIIIYKTGGHQGNFAIEGSVNVGLNDNGNSAIAFNWNGTPGSYAGQSIFWNNTANEFQIDETTAAEGYTIYHSGNLPDFAPLDHVTDTSNPHNVTYSQTGAEADLGTPTTDNEVLTSLADGTRQWQHVSNVISMSRIRFIGDGSTTTFITDPFTPNNADVYYNGVKLLTPEDVDISSGTEIVFSTAPDVDDIIEFVGYNVSVQVTQP